MLLHQLSVTVPLRIMLSLHYLSFCVRYNGTFSHDISLSESTDFPNGDKETCPLDAVRNKAEFMVLKVKRKRSKYLFTTHKAR